jgi:hypothetical protein
MGISRTAKVERLVNEHLRAQGRRDPKGGFRCFWCPNKTSTSSIETSGTLKIVKNGLELRKLRPPKVEGGEELKKKKHQTFQSRFLNNKKIPHMLPYCY